MTLGDWTDDDGEPMGAWHPISRERYYALADEAGGFEALAVFSTLTDPDGVYGPPTIFTAWGRRDADVPLVSATRDRHDDTVYAEFTRFPTETSGDA